MDPAGIIKTVATLPITVADTTLRTLFKTFMYNFGVYFIVYIAMDYFVNLWDNAAIFSSWRANSQAEKLRGTLDKLYGFQSNINGLFHYLLVLMIFIIIGYSSYVRYGFSVYYLIGPSTVYVLGCAVYYFLRLINQPNCEDNSFGCTSWYYIQNLNNYFFIDDDANNNILIYHLLGLFMGTMLAIVM